MRGPACCRSRRSTRLAFIHSVAVGSTGDIFVEAELDAGATAATVTFSSATEPSTQVSTTFATLVLGRYSSANVLKLGADLAFSFVGQPTGIALQHVRHRAHVDRRRHARWRRHRPAPPGPGDPAPVALVAGAAGQRQFPDPKVGSHLSGRWVRDSARRPKIFPRPPRGDYITLGNPDQFHGVTGQVAQVLENATTATILTTLHRQYRRTRLRPDDALVGRRSPGSAPQGPTALNPWSPTTTNIVAGQSFIIGAKDNGTSFGPWLTTNSGTRAAGFWKLSVTATGDLIVFATGGGGRRHGRCQPQRSERFSALQDTQAIFKLATATGTVVWKTGVTARFLPFMTVAPDGAVIIVASPDLDLRPHYVRRR